MSSSFVTGGIRFSRAILMARGADGVAQAVNFYQNALGMKVVRHTDDWAELTCGVASQNNSNTTSQHNYSTHNMPSSEFRLSIKAVETESQLSHGYSPILNFDVDDMDSVISRCAQMGAHLDGPIQYPAHGKVAAMRSPDGHMFGLYEPTL